MRYGIYKLAESAIAKDVMVTPEVDKTLMYAHAVICSGVEDWDGERILPEGIDIETRYRQNPVVLWEHAMSSIPFPIAKSEAPNGNLTVKLVDGKLEAASFFTSKLRESEQIFDLICERIVRAASIHVDPTAAAKTQVIGGHPVTVYPRSTMLEWSWCAMGANPDAVAKVLDRNRLAGSAICDSLAKSLKPLVPRRKSIQGWTLEAEPSSPASVEPASLVSAVEGLTNMVEQRNKRLVGLAVDSLHRRIAAYSQRVTALCKSVAAAASI